MLQKKSNQGSEMNICSLLFCYILRKFLHVDNFCFIYFIISLFVCLFIYLFIYLSFPGSYVTTRSLPFLLAGWILLRTSKSCKS